jgi:hypothetical protein
MGHSSLSQGRDFSLGTELGHDFSLGIHCLPVKRIRPHGTFGMIRAMLLPTFYIEYGVTLWGILFKHGRGVALLYNNINFSKASLTFDQVLFHVKR